MRLVVTLLAVFLFASGVAPEARAQTPGSCELGTAEADLDVSNVFARVFNTGSLFFGGTTTNGDGYLVPQGAGASPLFAAGLWLGGTVDGDVRFAGSRYNGFTFWPGPLDEGGVLPNPADCSGFDQIYTVTVGDLQAYESTGTASERLAAWPVGLGAPAVTASGAAVRVTSRTQTLNLAAGERPALYGSQTAFWVMNDVGGSRRAIESDPLGVEVRVIAYSIASREIVGALESTFYRYEVINRGASTIEDLRIGFFADPDLGNGADDYIGTDAERDMTYVYNAEDTDSAYGTPPALGFDLLSGAEVSMFVPDGVIIGSQVPNPRTAQSHLNLLSGLWDDGSVVRESLFGYQQPETFPITTQMFTGDPVQQAFWSEVNADGEGAQNAQGDRLFLSAAPAADLASGESRTVDLGILFAQGDDRFDSITDLRAVSDAAQAAYDGGSLFTLGGTGSGLATLAAPEHLAPEAGRYIGAVESVTFEWTPVEGAESYELVLQPRFGGGTSPRIVTTETSVSVPASEIAQGSAEQTVGWRVRAIAENAISTLSETQSFSLWRGGVLTQSNGQPGYVEIANGNGTDPCGNDARSTAGCEELAGNPIYQSLNSTNDFYVSEAMGARGDTPAIGETLVSFAPDDFEIRFTDEGSLAAFAFQEPYTVIRVPFEVWNIGNVGPGNENDPSDDIRFIPILLADGGGTCAFSPDEILEDTFGGFVESDRLYAYPPATSYDDFESAFAAQIDAEAEGCVASDDDGLLAYTQEPRAIQNLVFGSRQQEPALPAVGTVLRLYTTGIAPPADEPAPPPPPPSLPEAFAVVLGPNPTRGGATLYVDLPEASPVEIRVFDALGRLVSVVSDAEVDAGEPTWTLPDDLASGVYAVEVRAGTLRATRLMTVIR